MTFYTLRAATASRLYPVERVTLRAVFGFEEICALFDALIAACVLRWWVERPLDEGSMPQEKHCPLFSGSQWKRDRRNTTSGMQGSLYQALHEALSTITTGSNRTRGSRFEDFSGPDMGWSRTMDHVRPRFLGLIRLLHMSSHHMYRTLFVLYSGFREAYKWHKVVEMQPICPSFTNRQRSSSKFEYAWQMRLGVTSAEC
ncbi:uncharacterized protein CLUP02_12570 [Colletotrichum lupini]|uniref:Uncharacterized protein n=1 Tax=Colletotrichum lupini TaxID=145971 RepID=A0A9Q8WKK7_9PEZI|nr:uncharacterized protein CLUP02_12570 [Colletotrichum lupini]UQC87068.1 hypothetical protein CLUP02_12570 [Colletotrichum lupini]